MLVYESADDEQNEHRGLWACKLDGDSYEDFTCKGDALLINATLESQLEYKERLQRSTLSICLFVDDNLDVNEQTFVSLCSFVPGKLENFSFEMPLTAGVRYILKVDGPNPIDVIGFFTEKQKTERTAGDKKGGAGHENEKVATGSGKRDNAPITPQSTPQKRRSDQITAEKIGSIQIPKKQRLDNAPQIKPKDRHSRDKPSGKEKNHAKQQKKKNSKDT